MKKNRKKQAQSAPTPYPEIWIAILLAFLALAAMAASIRNDYVSWDDDKILAQFPPISVFGVSHVLKQILSGTAFPDKAYYPVFQLFWLFDVTVFGKNPALSHLLNLILHIANTLLLWRCVNLLLRQTNGIAHSQAAFAAIFAAAFFAVHPVNVEPVNWVSGRKVLLAFFFSILSFRAVLSGGWGGIAGGACFYALAVLSNATALGMAPLLAAWLLFFNREKMLLALGRAAPFFLIAAIAAFFRAAQQKAEVGAVLTKMLTWNQNLGLIFSAQAHQFWDLFVPTSLIAVYPRTLDGLASPSALAGIALVAALAAATIFLWRSGDGPRRTAAFGIVWYLLILSPMIWHHHERADRHLYLAAPGIFLSIGLLFAGWAARHPAAFRKPRKPLVLAAAAIACLIVLSNMQVRHWRDSETLFRHAIRKSSQNFVAYVNLGNALEQKKNMDGALAAYLTALDIKSDNYNVHASLGSIYLARQEYEKAKEHLRIALALNDQCRESHNNLGIILAGEGQNEEALLHFEKSVQIAPFYIEGLHNLAKSLIAQNRPHEALPYLEKALQINPRLARAYHATGQAWAAIGDPGKALNEFRRAFELEPDKLDIALDLCNALYEQGQYEEISRHLHRTLETIPDRPEIHQLLALNYIHLNQPDLAETHFRKAALLHPDDPAPRFNLAEMLLQRGEKEQAAAEYRQALDAAQKRGDLEMEKQILSKLEQTIGQKPKPSIKRKESRIMPNGEKLEQFTFANANNLEVTTLNFGATITTVKAPDRNGRLDAVTIALNQPENYPAVRSSLGMAIGRCANRISGGGFTLDGVRYELPSVNEQGVHLHGGAEGFQRIFWEAEPFSDDQSAGVKFSHLSPDGHEGYPGNLKAEVVYRLTNENELWMEYTAVTDKPTIINMTNHAFWNLAGAGSGDVLGHRLMLNADRYLPLSEKKVPTGEKKSVKGTPMDFTATNPPRTIGLEIEKLSPETYDFCFVLKESKEKMQLAAQVIEPQTGRKMEIYTTEPGLQFYIPVQFADSLVAVGAPKGKFPAFCLETQHFPDAPNQPDFPSVVLRPGETYRHVTMHKFSVTE